jgi:hypothetical protein
MPANTLIYILFGYCVAREIVFFCVTQRLVNKIMSRSYHEFKLAENVGKIRENPRPADEASSFDLQDQPVIGI